MRFSLRTLAQLFRLKPNSSNKRDLHSRSIWAIRDMSMSGYRNGARVQRLCEMGFIFAVAITACRAASYNLSGGDLHQPESNETAYNNTSACASGAAIISVPLSGSAWKLSADGNASFSPLQASVPGYPHSLLFAAGLVGDPLYR